MYFLWYLQVPTPADRTHTPSNPALTAHSSRRLTRFREVAANTGGGRAAPRAAPLDAQRVTLEERLREMREDAAAMVRDWEEKCAQDECVARPVSVIPVHSIMLSVLMPVKR